MNHVYDNAAVEAPEARVDCPKIFSHHPEG